MLWGYMIDFLFMPVMSKFDKSCSGRDLNPGSATRKATMLDRIVQLIATTPPEQSSSGG